MLLGGTGGKAAPRGAVQVLLTSEDGGVGVFKKEMR